ncbi:hypothetical protein SMC26_07990 [Actinomadura fulvescens]|uniref:Tyr recombinase domain-containing protein n=1 Tax=Actinomadura fulvescens TaxID=46160 RepID=A0ABN3QWJ0_9ACTN
MTTEPITPPVTGSGPGATVLPLAGDRPARYTDAVQAYLTAAGISTASRRVYRVSLTTWAWLIAGDQPPAGRARRGAVAPAVALADLDAPGIAAVLATSFAVRAQLADADTVNRELSVLRAATAWWRARGWLTTDPVAGLARRPAPPDLTRALSRDQVTALLEAKAPLREKTFYRLLYESCARAEEILTLDIADLVLPDKRARVISKGGATEWGVFSRTCPQGQSSSRGGLPLGPALERGPGRVGRVVSGGGGRPGTRGLRRLPERWSAGR